MPIKATFSIGICTSFHSHILRIYSLLSPLLFTAKEDYQREMENYKTKVREMELTIGNMTSEKKGLEEQVEVTKKNLTQFQEICNSNETALNTLTKVLSR